MRGGGWTDRLLLGVVWTRRCRGHPCGNATLDELNLALPCTCRGIDSVDDILSIECAGRNVDEHMVRDAIEVDSGHSGNGLQDGGQLGFLAMTA